MKGPAASFPYIPPHVQKKAITSIPQSPTRRGLLAPPPSSAASMPLASLRGAGLANSADVKHEFNQETDESCSATREVSPSPDAEVVFSKNSSN